MAQHIGIVAVSPEGAALFYQQVTRHASRMLPPDAQPRISLHNEPLAHYIDALRRDDWHAVGRLLRKSAELLARCGAQFCLTPDHAVQHGVYLAEAGCPIPWVSMTDMVAQTIAADGRKKVGIIGTRMVTRASTYQTHLGLRGIQVIAPEEHDAETLDQIIFNELIWGHIRPESRQCFTRILHWLADHGCEAVILGSSEAPMAVSPQTSPLPLYDAGEILATGAVRRAIQAA